MMSRCIGAKLIAVTYIQTALTALLQRFPDLRLAVPEADVQWKSGMAVRGPVALPIAWPRRSPSTPPPAAASPPTRVDTGQQLTWSTILQTFPG
jgi:hypothetical protein